MTPEQIEQARTKLRDAVYDASHGRYYRPRIVAALDALVRFERAEAALQAVTPCTTPSHANPPSGVLCDGLRLEAELDRIIRETLGTEGA